MQFGRRLLELYMQFLNQPLAAYTANATTITPALLLRLQTVLRPAVAAQLKHMYDQDQSTSWLNFCTAADLFTAQASSSPPSDSKPRGDRGPRPNFRKGSASPAPTGNFFCTLHGKNYSHNTNECRVLLAQQKHGSGHSVPRSGTPGQPPPGRQGSARAAESDDCEPGTLMVNQSENPMAHQDWGAAWGAQQQP